MYNKNMDTAFIINSVLIFLTLVLFLGGCISYVLNKMLYDHDRIDAWKNRHYAEWNKEGDIVPNHENCKTCEITVANLGGELVSHSSME